jgi:hypothetical protein
MAQDALQRHRKHLQAPPDDFLAAKLDLLGVSQATFAKAPPLVVKGKKPARVHPKEGFTPTALGTIKRHTARLRPDSLATLKELAGVPERAFQPRPEVRQAARRRARPVAPEPIRAVDDEVIARLSPGTKFAKVPRAEQEVVWNAGYNLLHGAADEATLARPGYTAVAEIMLELAQRLSLFFAQDLVVESGASVQFDTYGVLYFNNVLVYGSGEIRLADNAKLHAYAITHL